MIATGIFNDFVVGNKGGSVIEPRTLLSFSFPSMKERLGRQRKNKPVSSLLKIQSKLYSACFCRRSFISSPIAEILTSHISPWRFTFLKLYQFLKRSSQPALALCFWMFIALAYLLAWSCIILLIGRLFGEKFALVYLIQANFFSLTSKYFPSQTHSSERSPVYQFPFNFSALFFSLEITTRIPSKISLNIFPFFKFLQQLQPFC